MSTESGAEIPDASVIIACYNATNTLPKQLEALSRQEEAPAFEVILSDNSSDDDLLAIADEWADRLDVHYVWSGQMPGAAYARNVGMSIARADKWLFCDADDIVAPDWVACGVLMLDSVPVFSGGAVHGDDDEMDAPLEDIWARLWPSRKNEPVQAAIEPADWPIIMGGNFGLRRTVALNIGGFDASIVRGVEDNDLAVRLEDGGVYVSGGSTRIVYRKQKDLLDHLKRSFLSGQGHVLLVARHDLAARSPELRGRRWMVEPLKIAGSALKNALKGRDGDWAAVCARAGVSVGLWRGWLQVYVRHRLPVPRVGAGLCDVGPEASERSRVLVLSPHLDDALFSCAELIRRTRPDVWTVFAGDPEPPVATEWDRSCGYSDSHALVAKRRLEDLGAFEGTGARVRHLDLLDGAYTTPERRRADLGQLADEVRRWVSEHVGQQPVIVLPACAGVPVSTGALDGAVALVKRLARGGARASRVPGAARSESVARDEQTPPVNDDPARTTLHSMEGFAIQKLKQLKHQVYRRRRARALRRGLAANLDHVAVRDLVLDLVSQETLPARVLLVEDLPYLWSQPADDEITRVATQRGAQAVPYEFHVDRDWKQSRISHYGSQLDVMDPVYHRLSRPETIPPVERCWELTDQASVNLAE